MKTLLKTLLLTSISAVLTFAVTSCKTHDHGANNGMHTMGSQKSGYMMHNADMPTR
jgi:hypothetical protein